MAVYLAVIDIEFGCPKYLRPVKEQDFAELCKVFIKFKNTTNKNQIFAENSGPSNSKTMNYHWN